MSKSNSKIILAWCRKADALLASPSVLCAVGIITAGAVMLVVGL